MLRKLSLLALALPLLVSSSLAIAAKGDKETVDPIAVVRKALSGSDIPPIKGIADTPIPGMKGVVLLGGAVIYVTADGKTLIHGTMLDSSGNNLSDMQSRPFLRVDISKLPLVDAIKRVKGNGSRILVTFEDVNCGFCKKLTRSIEKIDNVTVYTFLVAILSQDSKTIGDQIWCSANPAEAWVNWSLSGTRPASKSCDTPLERNTKLLSSLGGGGTPYMILKSGDVLPGYMSPEQLEAKLR